MKVIITILFLILSGCSKGPKEDVLRTQLQARLDNHFQSSLFKIDDFDRRGSYSYEQDGPNLLVYFKARLKLLTDYKFSNWDKLGAASLISQLGSTPSGIKGINPEGNKKGDTLEVYGGSNFKKGDGDKWIPVPFKGGKQSQGQKSKIFVSDMEAEIKLDNKNLSPAKRYLLRLQTLATEIKDPESLAIFENDLKKVVVDAQIRSDLGKKINGIASGAIGGEYYLFGKAIENNLEKDDGKYHAYATFGSVHNINLVKNKVVRYGIAQGDLLSTRSRSGKLVALMSIYPEAVQVITLASSAINSFNSLQNKKVNIGEELSGTRINAIALIRAHGLSLSKIQAFSFAIKSALENLVAGNLDAIIFTAAYPLSTVLQYSKTNPIKFVQLDSNVISKMVSASESNLPLTNPANTSQGIKEKYFTFGSPTILFTHQDTPNKSVSYLLKQLFTNQTKMIETSSKASDFSRESWNRGIPIPIHPASSKFFLKGTL